MEGEQAGQLPGGPTPAHPPPPRLQDSGYVIALRSYITDDRSLLSFHRGDLIKLLPVAHVEPGTSRGQEGGADAGRAAGGRASQGQRGRWVRPSSLAFQAGSSAPPGAARGSFLPTSCSRLPLRFSPRWSRGPTSPGASCRVQSRAWLTGR